MIKTRSFIDKLQCNQSPLRFPMPLSVLQNHGSENRRLGALTIKFIHLLHNFLTQDALRAHKLLHKYTQLLRSVFPQ